MEVVGEGIPGRVGVELSPVERGTLREKRGVE